MADLTVQDLDPRYVAIVQKYGGDGLAMLAQDAEKAADYLQKAEHVLEESASGAALGAGIGAAIPVLGELGITEVIGGYAGAYIAGVIGAFDEFGGDITRIIHNVLNPDDFTPGDYDRMRRQCICSGGLPVPGKAPDNEDGCIYPSGGTSGGDYPRDPGPGKMVRGDNPYPAPIPPGMCPDANGNPVPCTKITPTRKLNVVPNAANALAVINTRQAQLKFGQTAAKNAAAVLMAVQRKQDADRAVAITQILANAKHIVAMRHGDPTAAATVKSTVDAARSGDPQATVKANALAVAAKLQTRQRFVDKWVHGIVHA